MGVNELLFDVCETLGIETRDGFLDPYILLIDHANYQRATIEERISDHEIELSVGRLHKLILVAHRKDASYWLVDGQHYVLAARRVGIPRIRALVFESAGPQDELRVFNAIQERQGRPPARVRDSL